MTAVHRNAGRFTPHLGRVRLYLPAQQIRDRLSLPHQTNLTILTGVKNMRVFHKLALAGFTLAAALPCIAQAGPQQTAVSQVPGYYHHPIGELLVTAVYDGYLDLDTQLLKGMKAEDMHKLFER